MSKNGTLFIINLSKSPEGYTFQSFQEAENVPPKKKNTSKDKSKNTSNRTIHRISRQLGLDTQQPEVLFNPIPEESQPLPKIVQPQIQEQFSSEIKRENVPESPAKWYNQSSIHEIEKQALPQFFNGKTYKTPGLYLKFRNFIVALYHKNPSKYLTKIACRRILRGDVNTIMKIHSFLQKQGVINFCISKQGNYSFSTSIFCRALKPQSRQGIAIDKIPETDEQKTSQSVDMTNITLTTVNKVFSKSSRVFCHKCQSICGIIWYKKVEQSDKNITICNQCYDKLTEKQVEEYQKVDIIKKIQSGVPDNKAVWSIQDNLKLLNFVSQSNKKWDPLINSFQKKKTFDDIMLQFMQFPIGNFDPSSDVPPSKLNDQPQFHINKLVNRMSCSIYTQPDKIQLEQDLNNKNFSQNMLKLTKNLCQKFTVSINKNKKISNDIQAGLFQVCSYKTLSKKRIQDQQLSERKQQVQKKEYENSEESNQLQQYQQNQRQNDINQEHQENIKDQQLEDLINNLSDN